MTDLLHILGGILGGYNPFDTGSDLNPSHYHPPVITDTTTDERGYPVIHIEADNYIDAANVTVGSTYPGNNMHSIVSMGGRQWEVRIEPYRLDNEKPEETRAEYQARIDKERDTR